MSTSLKKYDTDFPADAVEFCPHVLAQDILVCGTYKLLEERDHAGGQQRIGRCLFLGVSGDGDLNFLQKMPLPAVPDLKWCHVSSTVDPVLAVADSEGGVNLVRWSTSERQAIQFQKIACGASDTLCLSLDWSSRRFPTSSLGSLVVSQSDGSLSLIWPRDGTMMIAENWHAHDHEPWIAAWNYWNTNVLFSGGDDLKMKGWDIRQSFDCPIFENRRFESGVTAIQNHPYVEHLLAVGSYDEKVRLFDVRKPLRPLQEAHVGGGVWRVKWHPSESRQNDLLVACMHDGFKVIRFDPGFPAEFGNGSFEILRGFEDHESLAYGVDWSFVAEEDTSVVASCSFYDHTLHLWRG